MNLRATIRVFMVTLALLPVSSAFGDYVSAPIAANSNGLGSGGTAGTAQYATLLAPQTRSSIANANANVNMISAFNFAATPPIATHNFVRLAFNVFTLHQPFSVTVPINNRDSLDGLGVNVDNFYQFQITMNNMLGQNSGALFGYNPGDFGKAIGPYLVQILGNAAVTFVNPPLPTTSTSATNGTVNHPYGVYGAGIASQQLIFGGHSGGGGETPTGSSTTLNFVVSLPANATAGGNFTLQFTANPEPGSLAFAGLLGIPGLLGLRRRRNQVTAPELPTAAV